MPRKVKVEEPEIVEVEREPEPKLNISKRTGKPKRQLTELQKENLRKGREKAVATRKALIEGIDLEKRAENIKKAKEEVHRAKIESQKKKYEDAVKDFDEKIEPVPKPKAEKKIKKKIVKYVEESSSDDSEEEEVIIRKKKKDKPAPPAPEQPVPEQVSRDNLRKKLQDEQSASMARMLAPSYF